MVICRRSDHKYASLNQTRLIVLLRNCYQSLGENAQETFESLRNSHIFVRKLSKKTTMQLWLGHTLVSPSRGEVLELLISSSSNRKRKIQLRNRNRNRNRIQNRNRSRHRR
uniref:Uncharacterized protein n=1 Tax=Cacopsylla melanoneura TaxID=428564 RepID=A0A8D8YSN8_9HEMI